MDQHEIDQIEDIIANWMGEPGPPPAPYYTSLDAMAKAEAKLLYYFNACSNRPLFYAYIYRVDKLLRESGGVPFDHLTTADMDAMRFLRYFTVPARIRARALAYVLREIKI